MLATKSSKNLAEAASRSITLYRKFLRAVPYVKTINDLPHTHSEIRGAVNYNFRKNLDVTDASVVDLLVFKGTTELEEIMMQYKQRSHIMRIIESRA